MAAPISSPFSRSVEGRRESFFRTAINQRGLGLRRRRSQRATDGKNHIAFAFARELEDGKQSTIRETAGSGTMTTLRLLLLLRDGTGRAVG
jgi:hypothetical protein